MGLENVNVKGGAATGGLIGSGAVYIDNCYVTGAVSGDYRVGGVVGDFGGMNLSVTNCYTSCDVVGTNYVGGIIGSGYAIIRNCHSNSKVTGRSDVGSGASNTFVSPL